MSGLVPSGKRFFSRFKGAPRFERAYLEIGPSRILRLFVEHNHMRIPGAKLSRALLMAAAGASLIGGPMEAQSRNLRGIITDSAGYPLPNVEVRIMELGRMSRSDV